MKRQGPQEPPQDPRIFNRRQTDGTYRPLSEFFDPNPGPGLNQDNPQPGVDFDPDKPMCQDDYEFFSKSGRYAVPEPTPEQREQLKVDAWDEERGWPPNDEDLVEYSFDANRFEWVRL